MSLTSAHPHMGVLRQFFAAVAGRAAMRTQHILADGNGRRDALTVVIR